MDQVVEAVARVSNRVTEITAASNEQALGVQQVNHAVGHMDEVVTAGWILPNSSV
jgi:methyl-accepting chemotaxis protein